MKNKLPFLYNLLEQEYSSDELNKIDNGFKYKRPTTFRVNTLKSNIEEITEFLNRENISYELVSWYNDAVILRDNVKIQEYSIYKEGKIYLQSLSSMLPVLFLDLKENDSVLDMAASPGGKTTQIAALTNNSALITAVEKNKIRSERLKYNIEKQGAKKVSVLVEDARGLSDWFKFDKILLDAPCSGSGTLFLEDDRVDEIFTQELVDRSIKTQEIMLKKACKLLKKNGTLIYSTCSILKEENEEIIKKILKDKTFELIPIDISKFKDIPLLPTIVDGVVCVSPSKLYEGFFIAKLKKVRD